MRSLLNKITNEVKIWDIYYPVIIICYILTVFTAVVHPGVIASALLILIGGCAAVSCVIKEIKANSGIGVLSATKQVVARMNICDSFMLAFVIYNLLSVIWLNATGMPLAVYTGELATFILPSVMYIVARCYDSERGFYRGYLYGLILLCAVGLIFYVTAPQVYLNYLYDWSYISLADAPTMRVRMQSVCGSTILGSFSAVAILVGAKLFMTPAYKKADGAGVHAPDMTGCLKQDISLNRVLGLIGIIVGFAFAVFSNQRSAMVVAVLALVYLNVLAFFTFNLFKRKYFYVELGVIAVIFVLVLIVAPGLLLKIFYRLISLPSAIGERSEQWVAAVNMMYSSWIGNGLGANGHRALGIEGVKVVADGGLVKMFCENGVVGFSLFIYLLILTFKRGIKKFSKCFAELGIIAILLLQSIGSNVLSFQLITPIFWYVIGRIAYNTKFDKQG